MELTASQVQTLLGRELDTTLFDLPSLQGQTVMVTGAGGSIGSALCKAILALQPSALLLYEANEYSLYSIERALAAQGSPTRLIPVLGTLSPMGDMVTLLRAFHVESVYHTAAYKHVPMVERNPVAGVRNNVCGTVALVRACKVAGVARLLTVSTDKAVNPTNVMGATKRLAEYATLLNGYRIVRFGNVLGSSGSVIPLFCNQLHSGKSMTITHRDVTRYFMSPEEAVGLILQSQYTQGKISVLDMGVQVRIEDMASRLADMLDKPAAVKYVGLRPGEKMYEELTLGECLEPTSHPHILSATEELPLMDTFERVVHDLGQACKHNDVGAIRLLFQQHVPGYHPACGIVDDLWLEQNVYSAKEKLDDEWHPTPEAA